MKRLLRNALLLSAALAAAGCGPTIHDMIAVGKADVVDAMLAEDASLANARNYLEKTPLHFAVTVGNEAIARALLSHGADVDAADTTGLTPLHIAAIMNQDAMAQLLLDSGANPNAKDDFEDTPLHSAALWGRIGMIELLVKNGADLNARNIMNKTPADSAESTLRPQTAAHLRNLAQ